MRRKIIYFILLFILPATSVLSLVNLTEEEIKWLAEHPTIKVSSELDWPPFNFIEDGKPSGFSVEYMNLVASRIGLEIEYVDAMEWNKLLQISKDKELDIMLNIVKTPERSEYLNFTKHYIDNPSGLFTRIDTTGIKSLEDVYDKKLAVVRFFFHEEILNSKFPQIELVIVDNSLDGLLAVAEKKADAFINRVAVGNYLIEEYFITDVHAASYSTGVPEFDESKLRFGVRDDWPEIVSILEKGMDSVTPEEWNLLLDTWTLPRHVPLKITGEEEKWLAEHKDILLGIDPSWPPFEFVNPLGIYQGIGSDYVAKMNALLDVNMLPVEGLTWAEAIEKGKEKELDVFPTISKTLERSKYLLFTEPHTEVPMVLVTKANVPLISDLNELVGMKIAVAEGYVTHENLKRDYPLINLILVEDIEEGLIAIEKGKAIGLIDNSLSINYALRRLGLEDYKVSFIIPYVFDLRFGVRDDWPELVEILNKTLKSIPDEEKSAIENKWTAAFVERKVDWAFIWKIALSIATVALIIIVFFAYWNRKLIKEIKRREQAENALMVANENLKEMDKFKSQFLANMSHELRTPLNSIIGFTGILLMEMSGSINEKQKEQLNLVKKNSKHLLNLINDILDISKIEADKVELFIEKFKLNDIIKEIMENYTPIVNEKGLKLIKEIPADITLQTDKRRFKQVLMNLVTNAVKFTDVGSIKIDAEVLEDNNLKINVTDTGIGIKEKDMDKLFKSFQQIDMSSTKNYEGTGLGLDLSKKLVNLMDGDMSAKSEYGKGSIFTIMMPLKSKEK